MAARITDDAGQSHEDVVTIDYRPSGDGVAPRTDPGVRSSALAWAVERALTTAGIGSDGPSTNVGAVHDRGGELEVEVLTDGLSVTPGDPATLRVRLTNTAASEIRGEAQVLSPHETWSTISPWTQGFAVEPGGETIVAFDVAPPRGAVAGTYWALVKIMYFGRMYYTECVPVTIGAATPARVLEAVRP